MDAAPGGNSEQVAIAQLLTHVPAPHSYNDLRPRLGQELADPGQPVGDPTVGRRHIGAESADDGTD